MSSLTVHTFVVDLPVMFTPDMSGSTPDETEGWGWFSRKDVEDLPLHPDFEELWESVDWKGLGKAAAAEVIKVGPHGYVHGWIYVGPSLGPGDKADVTHTEHGHGQVYNAGFHNQVGVKYDDGTTRHYDAEFDESATPHFDPGTPPGEPLEGMPARSAVPGHYDYPHGSLSTSGSALDPKRAINFYVGSGYSRINGKLRQMHGDLDKIKAEKNSQVGDYISAIDAAMSHSALTHSIKTVRGATNSKAFLGPAWRGNSSMKGAAWVDDGFTSTSTDPDVATGFGMSSASMPDDLVLNITTPPGVHAIAMGEDITGGEQEVLLDRGLKFTVTHDTVSGDIAAGKARELEVTVSQP